MDKSPNRSGVLVALICLLGVSIVNLALSKTPDGQTPAEETACDGLTGRVFGLCNAYCEAMDCDSNDPRASEQACTRVLENFMEAADGALPPCSTAASACPCDFPSVLSFFDPLLANSCAETDFNFCVELGDDVILGNPIDDPDILAIGVRAGDDPGEFTCVSNFICSQPDSPLLFRHSILLSESEVAACQNQVRQIAASNGIECIQCGLEGEQCCPGTVCAEGLDCVQDQNGGVCVAPQD